MRSFKLVPIALALLLSFPAPAPASCHPCAVKTYVDAVNAHDVDRATARLAYEVRLSGPGDEVREGRAAVRERLGWDAATNATFRYDKLKAKGDSVEGLFVERNDVYTLLGVEELRYRLVFSFEGDLIREVRREEIDHPGPTVSEALEPFLAWATAHHPETLDAIYPAGRIAFDADSARKWLTLLREWRAG
jgi:hypothetical protein